MPPAATVAGPVTPSVTHLHRVAEGLRAELQDLRSVVAFNLPALHAIHDDPCKPAQRALLDDVITALTAAIENEVGQ
jgi:hypothetical protein